MKSIRSKEELAEYFLEVWWPKISEKFQWRTRDTIRTDTSKLLANWPGKVKGVKPEGIIGAVLLETTVLIYKQKRIKKPPSRKDIGKMLGVTPQTIEKRTNE